MDNPELEKVAREYNRAKAKMNLLRPRLYELIYLHSKTHGDTRGWQTELVKTTELTREQIRQIIAAEEDRRNRKD